MRMQRIDAKDRGEGLAARNEDANDQCEGSIPRIDAKDQGEG